MMSSRMAATRALMELLGLINHSAPREKVVFKSYTQMSWMRMSRSGYQKKLKRLEKHGLIKKRRTKNGHVFEITTKAKFLRSKAITKKSRTDGFSTLIIFDIPEDKHNARDTLRRYLIRSGYTQMRESCFLSPFQISHDLKALINELQLKSNITIFSAKLNLF